MSEHVMTVRDHMRMSIATINDHMSMSIRMTITNPKP